MLTVEDVEKAMKAELEVEELEVMDDAFDGRFHVKVDDKHEYDVYVGEDARKKAVREDIEENLCHFDASFLQHRLKVWLSTDNIESLKSLENNELIMALLNSFDALVDDAIVIDGAGHFLAHYDHEEHEVEGEFNGNTIYYYRV